MHEKSVRLKGSILIWLAACPLVVLAWSPNYDQPLDRPYTLRNNGPSTVEQERDRILSDTAPMSWVFPRPCISDLDSSRVCGDSAHLAYRSDSRQEAIEVEILGADEYRSGYPGRPEALWTGEGAGSGAMNYEAGAIAWGGKGPISYFVDARTFYTGYGGGSGLEYDREPVDTHSESATGSVSYASYSRYRANISWDFPFARLTAGRDAAQWGPGIYSNLDFQQDALPFNQYTLRTHVGPISIISLYGDLLGIHGNHESKNLYAHRYEMRIGRNWLLGITDEIIFFRDNRPYLFLPVFPLFISKTFLDEPFNNGQISADVTYRLPGFGMVYSEFLLDDMESPSSLFLKDYRENKWGVLIGAQWGGNLWGKRTGLILECSRVEPWVYTHFPDYPSQATNGDYPLGNPFGPNSQTVMAKVFTRPAARLYLDLKATLSWKGQDSGSAVTDSYLEKDNLLPKSFLDGISSPRIAVSPGFDYTWRAFHVSGQADIQRRPAYYLRFAVTY